MLGKCRFVLVVRLCSFVGMIKVFSEGNPLWLPLKGI
jgi:hypothetical protein